MQSIAAYACYKGASGWSEQVALYAVLGVELSNNLQSLNYTGYTSFSHKMMLHSLSVLYRGKVLKFDILSINFI